MKQTSTTIHMAENAARAGIFARPDIGCAVAYTDSCHS